jgi:hypothetical protein
MAFVVRPFEQSDKANRRVRGKLNAVVDAVNYLLRGEGGTVVYGTSMPPATTIVASGDHITVTEDPTGTWTADHDAPGDADEDNDTSQVSGVAWAQSQEQACTGTTVTLTVSPATLQFDTLGHRAGTTAGDDDEIYFVIPDVLNDLADVDAYPSDGHVLTWDGEKWIADALPEIPSPDDHKVLASVGGDTPDVLDEVLTAGTGITLTTALDGNSVEIGLGDPEDPSTTIDTLGSNSEGSETAATDTWTSGGTNGLALWQTCRVVYNEAGDEKLYEFRRKLTFDKSGRLYSVSGETRIEVDAPEDC